METFAILYFHVWVLVKYSFQGKKALATPPPEEQPGELSTACKEAISLAQGTVLLRAAENVGSWFHSVKFRDTHLHPPA